MSANVAEKSGPSPEQIAEWRANREREYQQSRERNDRAAAEGLLPRRSPGRRSVASLTREFVLVVAHALRAGISLRYIAGALLQSIEHQAWYWLEPRVDGPRCTEDVGTSASLFLRGWIGLPKLLASCDRVISPRRAALVSFIRELEDARGKAGILRLAQLAATLSAANARRVGASPVWMLERELESSLRTLILHAREGARSKEAPHVEALMGPWFEADERRLRTSPALARLRYEGLSAAPRSSANGQRVTGAVWLGAADARLCARVPSLLRHFAYRGEMTTVVWNRRASEKTLARDVARIIRAHRRYEKVAEAQVADDHPVLERARELGFTVVRDPAIRDGYGCEIDGTTLRIHARLTEKAARTLVDDALRRWERAAAKRAELGIVEVDASSAAQGTRAA